MDTEERIKERRWTYLAMKCLTIIAKDLCDY